MAVRSTDIIYSKQDTGEGAEGINVSDVDAVLGTGGIFDTSKLCASTEVNQWARWKPIIYPSLDRLTLDIIKSQHFGLDISGARNTKAEAVVAGSNGSVGTTYTWSEVKAANKAWGYNRPTGGASSPYRLHDFLPPSDATDKTWGYKHGTLPPVQGMKSFDITLDQLKTIYTGTSSTKESSPSSIYNIIVDSPDASGLTYQNMVFKFGEGSGQSIGSVDQYSIQLNELLEGVGTDFYRMGLLFFVLSDFSNQAELIVSRMTMYEAAQEGLSGTDMAKKILPDWATNPALAYKMYQYVASSGNSTVTFEVIPVIVKNACFTQVSWDENTLLRVVNNNSKMEISSMPGNAETITLTVINTEESSEEEVLAETLFEISSAGTGQYVYLGGTASANRKQLVDIKIVTKQDLGGTRTLHWKLNCTYLSANGSTVVTNNFVDERTVTVEKGTAAGTTVIDFGSRPEFNIVSSTLEAT